MAEVTDIGTAISLGTNLQPDRTQPLTRASNQWLANQMRQDALKAKQKEKQESELNTIMGTLEGGKFDAVLDPEARKVTANTILEMRNNPSAENLFNVRTSHNQQMDRLLKRQNLRDKIASQITSTPVPKDFAESFLSGKEEDWINKNPYQESITSFNGDVIVSLPKIKDVNSFTAGAFNKYKSSMANTKPVKNLQTGQTQYMASYTPQQLGQIAREMADNRDFRERLYLDNKKQMLPLIEQGIAKGLEPLEAKREAAYQIAYKNLDLQNQDYFFYGERPQFDRGSGVEKKKVQEYQNQYNNDKLYTTLKNVFKQRMANVGNADLPELNIQTFAVALPPKEGVVGETESRFKSIEYNPITKKYEIIGDNISSMNIGGVTSKDVEGEVVEVNDKDFDKVVALIATANGISKDFLRKSLIDIKTKSENINKNEIQKLTTFLRGGQTSTKKKVDY